jgi:hypothetical protein
MRNECAARKDQLLEAALTGSVGPELKAHLLACNHCAKELSALQLRRERLDALLPLVAQEVEPSSDFRARVVIAAESASPASRAPLSRIWGLAGLAGMTLAALLLALVLRGRISAPAPESDLATAQKLAAWRAPSDIFLQTPGREILRSTLKLGDSYLPIRASSPEQPPKEK